MKLVLLGPPGSGKGTQGGRIADFLSVPLITTSQLLKDISRGHDAFSQSIRDTMAAGRLVSDDQIIACLERRLEALSTEGYILDGFPRTVYQAEWLKQFGVILDMVLVFSVDDQVLLDRLSGRLVCTESGKVYHKHASPPKIPGVCDVSGKKLVQRSDDKPEVVRHRLAVYHQTTDPVIQWYQEQKNSETAVRRVETLDAQQDPHRVWACCQDLLS